MNLYDEAQALPMSDILEALNSAVDDITLEDIRINPYLVAAGGLMKAVGCRLSVASDAVRAGYLHPVPPEVFAPILLADLMSGVEGIRTALKYFDLKAFVDDCIKEGRMLPVQYQGRACVVEPASM